MLAAADVIAGLQELWAKRTPADVPTQFPGIRLDASGLKQWYEFWVTELHDRPPRAERKGVLDALLDVHCFSRGGNLHAATELADAARAALSGAAQPLFVRNDPGEVAGYLRIRESHVRDLSRSNLLALHGQLQHVVVSLRVIVEPALAAS